MAKKSFAEINAQYGISSGIDNGEEVIKKYITEASSFLSSVDEKSEKMTYGNANLFDTRRTIYEDLNNTYNSLNLWLSENRSNYTNDQFNKLKSSLKEIKSAIEVANNRYEEMEDYYSQWSSVDEYNNFLEGQKIAEKKNNRPAELGFSLTEGVVGVGRNIGNFITGNDEISAREYANQIMASDNTGFRKFANDTAGAVGGMLPSIALSMVTGGALSGLGVSKATASAIGATAGNVLLSSSAAGGAYTEMKRNGYNDAQAATYGVLVGASEGLLQSALGGIGNLGGTHSLSAQTTKFVSGIDNAFLRYAAKLPLNMASEGMEEAIQTALEPVFKSFVTGEDLEPAEWSEIAYSALVGAASAGLIEGVHTGAHTIGEAHYNSNLKKQYGSVSQDIVNTALQGTTDIEHATEMQEKLDSGKSLSGGNISHLLRSISTNDQAKIQSAVATDLDRRGETGDVQALSEAIAKKIANQPLTASEQKLINNSIYGIDLLQGLDPANIDNNPKLQSWDDSLNPDELAASMIDTEFAENIGTDLINAKQYNKGTGRDVNFLNNPKKRTNVAVDLEDEDKQLPEVSETTSDGSLESASKKYGAQAQAMVHTYIEGQDVEKFDNAYNIAYNMGKDGVSEEYAMKSNALTYLSETQRQLAYEAGKESKITDTSSDKINTTEAENERGVHLRNGSEWNRSQNTEEQISSVERGSGQTEGRFETRSRDSEAARLINEGREVTAASLGIPGGTDTKTVRALDSDKDTASMKRGRKLAESRGLKVTYFVGSNLSLKENGKDVSARAYINLSTGEVFVRADHPIHTAEQLLKHELGHDKIKKGEVNRAAVRKRLIELVGEENVKAVAEAYELAYRGSDMTAEEIWEECICDALADMNVFSGKEIKPFIDLMLPEVKTAVESTAKSPTQTRGSPEGKASREIVPKRDKYLYASGVSFLHKNFPAENERLSEAHRLAVWWARNKDVVAGDQTLIFMNDVCYLVECFDDALNYYQVEDVVYKKDFDTIYKEIKEYGRSGQIKSVQASTDFIDKLYKSGDTSNNGESGTANYQTEYGRKNNKIQRMGKESPEGQQRSSSDGSGDSQSRSENRQKYSRELETEYLSAVESGDMEKAQRLVDEAAKSAGYDYHLYHGTNADFTKFDLRKHGGKNGKGEGYGIYLAANKIIASPYGKNVIDSYVKFNRLAEGREKTITYAELKKLIKHSCELDAKRAVEDGEYDSISEAIKDTWVSNYVYTYDYSSMNKVYSDVADMIWSQNDNDGDIINEIMASSGSHYDYNNALNFYENVLSPTTGIDGFHYIWGNKDGSGEQNDIYLAFNSEQIKSADPVTYDDNGNVIPLSERFNTQEKDIRYSRELYDEDLYTATDDFIRDVLPQDRHAFARSLANKTTGMTKGEIRTIYVSGYVFEADGYMHGVVLGPYNSKTKKMLEVNSNIYEGLNKNNKDAALWTEDEVRNAKRGIGSNSNLSYRRRSSADDRLFDESSKRNASGDNERIRQTVETEAEIDEIVNKLRQMYGLDSVDNKYSRELDVVDYMNETSDVDESEPTSKRNLLVNALETTAVNDIERKRLEDYKKNVSLIEAEERKLEANRAEAKELRFKKGRTAEETKRLKALDIEANGYKNNINTYDKRLLNLESTTALKGVLNREVEKMRKKAMAKGREVLGKYRMRGEMSEIRTKIKNIKSDLENTLLKGTENKYIPESLVNAMIEVTQLIDTDTDMYKADGSINKSQEKRELTKQKLQNLAEEYEKLSKISDPIYKGEFDEFIYEDLKALRDEFAGKSLAELDIDELRSMYETLRSITDTLADARKLIGVTEAADVYDAGDSIVAEQKKISAKRKDGKRSAIGKAKDSVLELSLSPTRAVERISDYNEDSMLVKLMNNVNEGVRKKNKFVMDSHKAFESLTTGENAKKFEQARYEGIGKEYTDINGRKFKVSKMQMIQAILSVERETANKKTKHISESGFAFADLKQLKKGNLKAAISAEHSHRTAFTPQMFNDFAEILANDQWAMDYMTASRKFFNETAKKAINDTMIILKHRIVATEENYIPFEVDKNFIVNEISAENNIQQTINSYGMLKDTQEGASQPIILTGVDNVIERHIAQVGTVYGLAIPVRNFNKVWNVKSGDTTVKGSIDKNWGPGGANVITQAIQDVQGPRIRESGILETAYQKIKSGFIGATFLLNGSVVLKQCGSMLSARSMLDYRTAPSMFANLLYTMTHFKKITAEIDQYTATVWMRRQGLSDSELYTLFSEGKKFAITKAINKLPAVFNPAKWVVAMDTAVAASLWKYAKQDTAKRTGLEGEALLVETAKYFDEVIENTQSMSDVLHRPEIQKKNSIVADVFSLFKTDLYQNAGQLQVAAGKFGKKKSKENAAALSKVAFSVLSSMTWGLFVGSMFAMLRYKPNRYRDEEDELTVESWMKTVGSDALGEIFSYIFPIAGGELVDISDKIIKGESGDAIDSVVISAVNDLIESASKISKEINDGDGDAPSIQQWSQLLAKSLQMFGIPAPNILRSIEAIKLHAKDAANGEPFSFEAGLEDPNGLRLYNAMLSGDKERIEKAKRNYKDEDAITSAIRKALRENDPRIKEAAKANVNGNTAKYTKIIDEIIAEGKFEKKDIISAVRSEIDKLSPKEEEESESKELSKYKVSDYYNAIMADDSEMIYATKLDIIDTAVANGTDRDAAESNFNSNFARHLNELYLDGDISLAKAEEYLVTYGGKKEEEAKLYTQKWVFDDAYPDYKSLSKEQVDKYYKSVQNAGISVSDYYDFIKKASKATGVDNNNDGKADSGTVQAEIMEIIDSMPLTKDQKTALIRTKYEDLKLYKMPWNREIK